MAAGKRSKLVQRTVVGGAIAGGLALILWAASALDSVFPVLGVLFVLVAICILEVDRMGSLRGRALVWPLAAGAVASLANSLAMLDAVGDAGRGDCGLGVLWLLSTLALVSATITAAYALVVSRSWLIRIGALTVVTTFIAPEWEPALLVSVVALLFVALRLLVFGAERRGEAASVIGMGAILVVSLPALAWIWLCAGFQALVALIAICKLGDTAAYYVGNAIGKHRPFPSISPGKTTEGFVGSLLASSLAGAAAVVLGWLPVEPHGWLGGLAAGAMVNIAAQISDLLESWVKRKTGVKDSGRWFGPSGGMLDLVDSFFLASPVALIGWPLVLRFGHG